MTRVAVMPNEDLEQSINLLRRAQGGDEQARDELLARYLPRLERWASGRLPLSVRSMLDTGDIVQEAVIHAIGRLPTLEIRTDDAFEHYLKRAIKNRIIDAYRRPRKPREEVKDNLADDTPSALDIAINRETVEQYERALATLREPEMQIIVMHVELGMKLREIAEELGKTPDAARMALARALKRLAAEMRPS